MDSAAQHNAVRPVTETGTAEYLPLLAPYMETNTAIHTLELDDLIVVG